MDFTFQLVWKVLSTLTMTSLIYLIHINRVLRTLPEEAKKWSPNRWTKEEVQKVAEEERETPTTTVDSLPPRTGRRYIIVGGNGLVGGWIVLQLLSRGEDPQSIRIIDNRTATRTDLLSSPANQVPFIKADIRSLNSTTSAFSAPWPTKTIESQPLTIIHLAAIIRHYERHPHLLPLSRSINVLGTKNVLLASKSIGAKIFIATSSASVCIRTTNLFKVIPYFHGIPRDYCQYVRDGDERLPERHYDFFSNYAVSKLEAEWLVRGADEGDGGFRTGVLRPGNGVYGGGGDFLSDGYLRRGVSPTWIQNTVQSFTYAENAALAHLCYEKCLIDLSNHHPSQPDIGGQSFLITDPNAPITYGDFYTALSVLSNGRCSFPIVPQVLMYILAYLIERYYLLQTVFLPALLEKYKALRWLGKGSWWKWFRMEGDVINLQPSTFNLTSVHLWFDDERARRDRRDGGLGYRAPFTSLRAICKTGIAFEKERMGKMGK